MTDVTDVVIQGNIRIILITITCLVNEIMGKFYKTRTQPILINYTPVYSAY